jgi:hypothetical protein
LLGRIGDHGFYLPAIADVAHTDPQALEVGCGCLQRLGIDVAGVDRITVGEEGFDDVSADT